MSIIAPRDQKVVKKANDLMFPNLWANSTFQVGSITFGQSTLNFFQTQPTGSVVMSDGTNVYSQNLVIQRVGNDVTLTLRSVSSPVAAVALIVSTTGINPLFRPVNSVSSVIAATYPGGASLPALKLSVTSGGIIQIRKLDGTAFSGPGTIAYDECCITYSVV
jgi:hypothetical protein